MVNTTIADYQTYTAAKTTQFRGTTNSADFWLRSPFSGFAIIAWYVGNVGIFDYSNVSSYYGARPAFQLQIPA